MTFVNFLKMEKSFEQPSSKTFNVGAPTFFGVRPVLDEVEGRLDTASEVPEFGIAFQSKPSGFTLNVGAPTFSWGTPPSWRQAFEPVGSRRYQEELAR